MSEDAESGPAEKGADPFSALGREKAREGDSARARFYRKKDELLDWTMGQVRAFSRRSPAEFKPMMDAFLNIRRLKERLDSDIGDEAALSEATSQMESLRKMVDQSSLRDMPLDGGDVGEEPTPS